MNKRTIKFRVWDRLNKHFCDWVALAPQGYTFGCTFNYENVTEFKGSPICGLDQERFDVEQFIGLLDEKGKEIYEGDIIRMGEPRYHKGLYIDNNIGVVTMMGTQWALHPIETLGKEHGGIIYFPFWNIPPVIGNIHENSELVNPS